MYEPICDSCNEDGVIRLATEERAGIPLCGEHAKADDEREPPEPDLGGPTLQEKHAHEADMFHRDRWK